MTSRKIHSAIFPAEKLRSRSLQKCRGSCSYDVNQLEQDFLYNLNLLKLKDIEIARCTGINSSLNCKLQQALSELAALNAKIVVLERTLSETQQSHEQEQHLQLQVVNAMKENMKGIQKEYANRIAAYEEEARKRQLQMQYAHEETLNDCELRYQNHISTLQQRLQKEIDTTKMVQQELTNARKENGELHTRLTQQEEKGNSCICYLKKQLQLLEQKALYLQTELQKSEQYNQQVNDELNNLAKKHSEVTAELEEKTDKINSLMKKNQDAHAVYEKLEDRFEACIKQYDCLIGECDILMKEKDELDAELTELKVKICCNCFVPEHAKFDDLVKQNEILREVVRAMRKSKEENEYKDLAEKQDAEVRLDKMEQMLGKLKNTLMETLYSTCPDCD